MGTPRDLAFSNVSEGPLEARSPRNLEKNRTLSQPYKHERSRMGWRRLWRQPRPQTWQARAWGGQRPTVPPSREKTRLGREFETRLGVTWLRKRKSISRRGRQDAPPRSRETGGKGCRLSGRRGGTCADGRVWEVGADGRDRARAQGRASRPLRRRRKRERQRGRMRATQCGTHAGHTMRDACGPHNAGRMQTCEQTGRWERTG